jgi:hypothetical protein
MPNPTVTITAILTPEVEHQLAQFVKRSAFNTYYEFTDAHLSHEEPKAQA